MYLPSGGSLHIVDGTSGHSLAEHIGSSQGSVTVVSNSVEMVYKGQGTAIQALQVRIEENENDLSITITESWALESLQNTYNNIPLVRLII